MVARSTKHKYLLYIYPDQTTCTPRSPVTLTAKPLSLRSFGFKSNAAGDSGKGCGLRYEGGDFRVEHVRRDVKMGRELAPDKMNSGCTNVGVSKHVEHLKDASWSGTSQDLPGHLFTPIQPNPVGVPICVTIW